MRTISQLRCVSTCQNIGLREFWSWSNDVERSHGDFVRRTDKQNACSGGDGGDGRCLSRAARNADDVGRYAVVHGVGKRHVRRTVSRILKGDEREDERSGRFEFPFRTTSISCLEAEACSACTAILPIAVTQTVAVLGIKGIAVGVRTKQEDGIGLFLRICGLERVVSHIAVAMTHADGAIRILFEQEDIGGVHKGSVARCGEVAVSAQRNISITLAVLQTEITVEFLSS